MKRFFKNVQLSQARKGYFITLDGKKIRTPSRQELMLPTRALAQAIADEWQDQIDDIQPAKMPLTQLANTAIDRTRPQRTTMIDQAAAYARTDLLCYRVAMPPDLAKRQADKWQPLLDWCEVELGAGLFVTTDLVPIEQPEQSLLAIYTAVARLDDFALTGLNAAVAASGSVIIGLALFGGRLDAGEAFTLSQLDEHYQRDQWGEDAEVSARARSIHCAIVNASSFMTLSQAA